MHILTIISYVPDRCCSALSNLRKFPATRSTQFPLREKIEKQKNLHFSQRSVHLSTHHYSSHSLSLFFATLPSLSFSYAVCSWNPSAIDRSIKRLQFAVPSPDARQVSPQVPRLGHKTNVCACTYACDCAYVWECVCLCACVCVREYVPQL